MRPMTICDDTGTQIADEVSIEEGRALLDEAARKYLGMTREEFIEAWDGGRFADSDSLPVMQVVMLLPFGR